MCTCSFTVGKTKQVSFSMTIGNEELTHKCFPKHVFLYLISARKKYDKGTDKEGKKRGVSMKRSKAGTKKKYRWPITT